MSDYVIRRIINNKNVKIINITKKQENVNPKSTVHCTIVTYTKVDYCYETNLPEYRQTT